MTWVKASRYDCSRQRYLGRYLDPVWFADRGLMPAKGTWEDSDRRSDYDGDEIYGEFTVRPPQEPPSFPWPPPLPPDPKQERSFVMGLATVGWTDNTQGQRMPDSNCSQSRDALEKVPLMCIAPCSPSLEGRLQGIDHCATLKNLLTAVLRHALLR